jgi:hypothetical protein
MTLLKKYYQIAHLKKYYQMALLKKYYRMAHLKKYYQMALLKKYYQMALLKKYYQMALLKKYYQMAHLKKYYQMALLKKYYQIALLKRGYPSYKATLFLLQKRVWGYCNNLFFYTPALRRGRGVYCFTSVCLSVLPSVQDIFRHIFLSNYRWQKSDIWSQASYRYAILWVAFLDPSDSYFLFADFVDLYTH